MEETETGKILEMRMISPFFFWLLAFGFWAFCFVFFVFFVFCFSFKKKKERTLGMSHNDRGALKYETGQQG